MIIKLSLCVVRQQVHRRAAVKVLKLLHRGRRAVGLLMLHQLLLLMVLVMHVWVLLLHLYLLLVLGERGR